jgi:arylsulfatase A-like enzyme
MKFKQPVYLFCLLLLVSCGGLKRQPNVLFILIDDMGWKDLGCYGSDYYETPNMDALAASGIRFTDAYAASPLCSPTRASILTGQEPGRLRFTTPSGHVPEEVLDPQESHTAAPYHKAATPATRTRLPNEYLTFAEILKEQGYSTAFMGKWHLGREPYIPENQGFDHVVGGREHPGPPPPGRFFSPWDVETLPPVPDGTHICDVLTDEAIRYMEQNRDHPFLLCLWYYDVHAPYQSKEDLKKYYADKLRPDHIQRCPTMGGMIGNLDTNMGRVLQALRDLGLEDETIVVFTADNGGNMYDGPDGTTPTNNSPLRSGKGDNYEGGVRVPLIVRVPGVTKAGTTSGVVTSTVDHYISLLELLDIPFPAGQITDGESYVRALKGESYARGPIYSTFCHNVVATGNRANISMREGPWRLYKFFFDGEGQSHRYELYNLEEDISETDNLADEMPEKVQEMSGQMEAHIAEAEILLPRRNEDYAGNVAAGWLGAKDTEVSVKDRILSIRSGGNDPWVETVYTPNVSDETFVLAFEMKSESRGKGAVSWTCSGTEQNGVPAPSPVDVTHDGAWHACQAELPLTGVLNTIRIIPGRGPGDIQIRNIRLETKDGYYIRDWPLY